MTTEALTPTVGQTFRRARFWIVCAAIVVLIAIGTVVANSTAGLGTTFDPGNPGPEGGRALRSVLEQQGVQVTTTTTVDETAGAAGTLFVDDTDATIPASAWPRLLAGRTRIIVAGPDRTALDALLPAVQQRGSPGVDTAAAGCGLAVARRAGTMSLTDATLSLGSTTSTVCFATASGAGQLVSGTRDGVRVVLLADRTPFTNQHIASDGNAAVALGVLGATDRLVWFQQSPLDVTATGGRTLADLTPPWVTPMVVILLLAGVATALWQGRRLGPLVVESLPVIVRSRETVEGRARLYNRGSARLRAADSLRIGTIGRLAPMLGLPRSASVEQVVDSAARLTGGHREGITALLLTEEPLGDRDLVRISDDLTRLEAAVRAAAVPGRGQLTGPPGPTNGAG